MPANEKWLVIKPGDFCFDNNIILDRNFNENALISDFGDGTIGIYFDGMAIMSRDRYTAIQDLLSGRTDPQ